MRISSLIRFVEDKSLAAYAAAKPVVNAHLAAAKQAHAAYQASLQPPPVRARTKTKAKTTTKRR